MKMWTTCIITSLLLVFVDCDDSDFLSESFSNNLSNSPQTIDKIKCENIKGTVSECNNCYFCNSAYFDDVHDKSSITRLQIADSSCREYRDICCTAQKTLEARINFNCGKNNPEGDPPQLRPSLRSVVDYEYPWRAWIYSESDRSKPICGATFINEHKFGLLTSATCVYEHRFKKLFVKFSKKDRSLSTVKRVYVHEDYDADLHHNDLALLTLTSSEYFDPSKVVQVCYTYKTPRTATPCIAISSEDYYINTVIPKQSTCGKNNTAYHESLMCAVTPRLDYIPEPGGALFCLDVEAFKQAKKPIYVMHGIALNTGPEQEVTAYTNISHFFGWITNQLDKA